MTNQLTLDETGQSEDLHKFFRRLWLGDSNDVLSAMSTPLFH